MRYPKCTEEHDKKNCLEDKPECIFCQGEHKTYDKSYPDSKANEYQRIHDIRE